VHESEQAQLVAKIQAERAAEAETERARRLLLATTAHQSAAVRAEDRRMGERGITAAEGQRRVVWENTLRKTREQLAEELDRAIDSHRHAVGRHEQARSSVQRADAELKLVQERLDQRERSRQLDRERAQQETLDESSLRRFLERNGA
jgi:hypothetical protein